MGSGVGARRGSAGYSRFGSRHTSGRGDGSRGVGCRGGDAGRGDESEGERTRVSYGTSYIPYSAVNIARWRYELGGDRSACSDIDSGVGP